MNLIINHSSMEPIYEQLSRQFRALISTGQMKEGEPLPSVRALAKELRISALTVKKPMTIWSRQDLSEPYMARGALYHPPVRNYF